VIRPPAATSIRSCSSRSGTSARRWFRSVRPNRYAPGARCACHAWNGRWRAARRRRYGEAPAKTSGGLCGTSGPPPAGRKDHDVADPL